MENIQVFQQEKQIVFTMLNKNKIKGLLQIYFCSNPNFYLTRL